MAFKIRKKKVNRRYMFNIITAQQEKLNSLFAEVNALKNQKMYYEQRVNELMQAQEPNKTTSLYPSPVGV